MLRGCLFSLLLYAALSVGYYFWLSTVFEPPTSYWASALVGFVVLCCLGAFINARNAYRDWSLMSAGRRGLAPRDGRLIAVSGTIHPLGQPLVAPFSGAECVLCEYDLSRQRRRADSQGKENTGSDFTGFLMTPCVIRSPGGEVKLLGFPVLDGFGEAVDNSYAAARRAIDFLTTREFEDRSGLKMATVLSIFTDVWSDEDGMVDKNVRLGKISLPDLFPPELEAEIDRQLQAELDQQHQIDQGLADPAAAAAMSAAAPAKDPYDEDEHDDDDEPLSDDDLDLGGPERPEVPQMSEKRVHVGEEVCAIGRYNEVRGGLLPARGSTTPNRLLRGSADQLEAKSRSSIVSYLVGGFVALLVAHGATFGAMWAYQRSPEMARFRQKVAFEAVDKGDLGRLDKLVRRGMSINIRNAGEETLLMVAKDATVSGWLIEHGADVNAVDRNGATALMKAARSGKADIVKQLIAAKADLDRRSTEYHRSALMDAVSAHQIEIADLLRAAGAKDDVITAASGQPLPADGGPQLATCRAYLQGIRNSDPKALRAKFTKASNYDFEKVDWELWQNTRPVEIESWSGFVRGDDATITLSGTSGRGIPVTWVYQLHLTDGEWRIERESEP